METSYNSQHALSIAVYKLLRPLVRVLLRHGIPFAGLADIAKRAYVDVAAKEFTVPGKRPSNSRIAILTGLTRKEIQRLLSDHNIEEDRESVNRYNRAARVVYGWVHDSGYHNGKSKAGKLSLEQFNQLVKDYSGDVPARAILDELLRVGVVKFDERAGLVTLLSPAYIPTRSAVDKLLLLGRDVSGLISTMDQNIHGLSERPLFQRKVFYDNLPDAAVAGVQAMLAEDGQALLQKFDRYMSAHDRDSNPSVTGSGRRAIGVGLYFFEEKLAEQQVNSAEQTLNVGKVS